MNIAARAPVSYPREQPGFPEVHGLHHLAYRCKDAEETRAFYEDILGLPLAAVVYHERVPSTQEYQPYFHIFFEMADGSYIAFFDLLDGKATAPDPDTPAWVNHLALEVASEAVLEESKAKLIAAGVDVLGVVDHHWLKSIYFFDPNGIRLELTCRTASREEMKSKLVQARKKLAERAGRMAAISQA